MPDGSILPAIDGVATLSKPTRKARDKRSDDNELLGLMKASSACTKASASLAGLLRPGDNSAMFTRFCDVNRDLATSMWRRIRATVPVTEEGVKAKRKFIEEHDGTEYDDDTLAACRRYFDVIAKVDDVSLRSVGEDLVSKRAAALAAVMFGNCCNMETVIAKAKVVAREASDGAAGLEGDRLRRELLADLVRVGNALIPGVGR